MRHPTCARWLPRPWCSRTCQGKPILGCRIVIDQSPDVLKYRAMGLLLLLAYASGRPGSTSAENSRAIPLLRRISTAHSAFMNYLLTLTHERYSVLATWPDFTKAVSLGGGYEAAG